MRTRSVVRTNITEKEEDDKYLHITKKGREGRITSVSFVIRYGRGMCFGRKRSRRCFLVLLSLLWRRFIQRR